MGGNEIKTVVRGERGKRTVKNLIKTAFEPVGRVMYVYGGGWNESDDGAGREAMTPGLSQSFIEFENKQKGSYDYREYDYKKDASVIHKGLDCSGYVGWVIYNVLNDGKGYVTNSCNVGYMLEEKGFGNVTLNENVHSHRAGDIMFSKLNHVYISIGECCDGSVLLLHSSPPGVQLSGTYTPGGEKYSEAVRLAECYMKKYYRRWYDRFPENSRDRVYLTQYDKFEWSVLGDDEGYRNMCPEDILKDVFEEK